MKYSFSKFVIFTFWLTTYLCFARQSFGQIQFTENKGQIADQNLETNTNVLFTAVMPEFSLHITKQGVSYQLFRNDGQTILEDANKNSFESSDKRVVKSDNILHTVSRTDIEWLGRNSKMKITGIDQSYGFENYYMNQCATGVLGVKSYGQVLMTDLYAGIDLLYYSKNNQLKSDFFIEAGADYKLIKFRVDGAIPQLDKHGNLVYKTQNGLIYEEKPLASQNGKALESAWSIDSNVVSFIVPNYNPMFPLVIDPVTRLWGTYYGGSGGDVGLFCTTDLAGNIYFVGSTTSAGINTIATSGSYQQTLGGSKDGMIVKFNTDGVREWSTYYGGFGDEEMYSCAISSTGEIFVTGETSSLGSGVINSSGCFQPAFGGGSKDGCIVKFDQSGQRIWGTYFGGADFDRGVSCAVDTSGYLYICGISESLTGISTTGSHQEICGGQNDAFLSKFDTAGSLIWSTYYGGISGEDGSSCDVDNVGNIYLGGKTYSSGAGIISTTGSHQENLGGTTDAFIVKFDTSGNRVWGSYYGGDGGDQLHSLKVDDNGNLIFSGVAGHSLGNEIATPGSHQEVAGHVIVSDAFLAKFDTSGARKWGTYYGGWYSDAAFSCDFDSNGNIYIAGITLSDDSLVISTIDGHQINSGGDMDAFIAMFDSTGIRQWGSYYGSIAYDEGWSCATDTLGHVYLLGFGGLNDNGVITTTGAHQENYAGSTDAFLVKFLSSNGVAIISEQINEDGNLLFPNPNSDAFIFYSHSDETYYSIVDNVGRICASGYLSKGNNLITHNLVNGLYYFTIYSTSGHKNYCFIRE